MFSRDGKDLMTVPFENELREFDFVKLTEFGGKYDILETYGISDVLDMYDDPELNEIITEQAVSEDTLEKQIANLINKKNT